jgi:hypothetical protein
MIFDHNIDGVEPLDGKKQRGGRLAGIDARD